jgi:hypothetical protein
MGWRELSHCAISGSRCCAGGSRRARVHRFRERSRGHPRLDPCASAGGWPSSFVFRAMLVHTFDNVRTCWAGASRSPATASSRFARGGRPGEWDLFTALSPPFNAAAPTTVKRDIPTTALDPGGRSDRGPGVLSRRSPRRSCRDGLRRRRGTTDCGQPRAREASMWRLGIARPRRRLRPVEALERPQHGSRMPDPTRSSEQ